MTGERIMPRKRKPHEERQPEDYREAADDSLELAKVLAGQGGISDQDFLERMARSDDLVDHDGETCGLCHNLILGAQVAREMIKAGEYNDVVSKWATDARRQADPGTVRVLGRGVEEVTGDAHFPGTPTQAAPVQPVVVPELPCRSSSAVSTAATPACSRSRSPSPGTRGAGSTGNVTVA